MAEEMTWEACLRLHRPGGTGCRGTMSARGSFVLPGICLSTAGRALLANPQGRGQLTGLSPKGRCTRSGAAGAPARADPADRGRRAATAGTTAGMSPLEGSRPALSRNRGRPRNSDDDRGGLCSPGRKKSSQTVQRERMIGLGEPLTSSHPAQSVPTKSAQHRQNKECAGRLRRRSCRGGDVEVRRCKRWDRVAAVGH